MSIGDVPRLPSKRRVIVVVDGHDMERLEYEGGLNVLLDTQSVVVNADDPPDGELIEALDASNLLVPGQVLVQNPYIPDRYIPIATATADIAVSKHHLFTEFCFLLGAKSVSVDQLEVTTADGSTTFKAKGGRLGVGADLSAKHEQASRLGKQLTIDAKYGGGEADVKAAEAFLRRHRLLGDRHLESLLGMRRHRGNSLEEHTVTLSLTDQAKTNLKVAAKLKAPTFSFSADIERATSQSVEFTLTLKVRF